MIKLIPKPEVLEALGIAFPKPPKSAEKALNKYCRVLAGLLFDALQRGQAEDERKLQLYSISTSQLANKGGQIGKDKIRLHSWLADNGYPLVQIADKGSNIKGVVSKVKLTKWVTMDDPLSINTCDMTDELADREIEAFLTGDHASNEALFRHLYPELDGDDAPELLRSLFDQVDVDVKSLAAYVAWINTKAAKLSQVEKQKRLRQAKTILSVCAVTDGVFLQRRKSSAFGRTYYSGVSVQSMPKDLRKAMLGNCWEYDIRSSVIAWKMGFARDWVAKNCPWSSVQDEFKITQLYLQNKLDVMNTVRRYTFLENSRVSGALQLDLMKQAFTALSFGARLTAKGWRNVNGKTVPTALVDIIRNPEERARFVKDPTVLRFIKEQNRLDDLLFDAVKTQRPELLARSDLQTASGRPSKAKVVAFLYQHEETAVMNVVREAIKASGRKVLASIHDAVVINIRLSDDSKSDIEFLMQQSTGNPYWRLGSTQYERFNSTPKEVLVEEQQHLQRMDDLEQQAAGYKPVFAVIDSKPEE